MFDDGDEGVYQRLIFTNAFHVRGLAGGRTDA